MADGDGSQADRCCASCGDTMGAMQAGHDCRTCKKPVHAWAMCDKVWQPEYGAYFCSKACLVQYNGDAALQAEYDSFGCVLLVRHRPDSEVEAPQLQTQPH